MRGQSPLRDASGLYAGPIVDPHHHLWDLALGRHPWLRRAAESGAENPLTRNQSAADYVAAAAGHNVVATVHVEAGWEASDPFGEVAWLDSIDKPDGIALRYVAHADLGAPDVEAVLARHAAHGRIVGIRDILSWHPDPARAFVPRHDRMEDAAWRRGLGRLPHYGLSFDLMISPWQMEDAARLVAAHPDVAFILNHCGSPMDRDAEGMRRWHDGLAAIAQAPNVSLKISDLVAYDADWSLDSLRAVVLACIDAFGVARCALASDHPVEALHASFDQTYTAFKTIVRDFSDDDCAALFEGNARRIYRLPAWWGTAS
jgi:predicted TIM-barrel fold metal-dependent hydrolase